MNKDREPFVVKVAREEAEGIDDSDGEEAEQMREDLGREAWRFRWSGGARHELWFTLRARSLGVLSYECWWLGDLGAKTHSRAILSIFIRILFFFFFF